MKAILFIYLVGLLATAAWDIYNRVDWYREKGVKDPFDVDDLIGWFFWPLIWFFAGVIYAVRGIDNMPVWLVDWRRRDTDE